MPIGDNDTQPQLDEETSELLADTPEPLGDTSGDTERESVSSSPLADTAARPILDPADLRPVELPRAREIGFRVATHIDQIKFYIESVRRTGGDVDAALERAVEQAALFAEADAEAGAMLEDELVVQREQNANLLARLQDVCCVLDIDPFLVISDSGRSRDANSLVRATLQVTADETRAEASQLARQVTNLCERLETVSAALGADPLCDDDGTDPALNDMVRPAIDRALEEMADMAYTDAFRGGVGELGGLGGDADAFRGGFGGDADAFRGGMPGMGGMLTPQPQQTRRVLYSDADAGAENAVRRLQQLRSRLQAYSDRMPQPAQVQDRDDHYALDDLDRLVAAQHGEATSSPRSSTHTAWWSEIPEMFRLYQPVLSPSPRLI